ncbi:hypothetical protein B566_EDAN006111 [Ephemera danica]|nr:hypothetical protein B566_EDAN006111 [Ephemera danica]
MSGDWLTIEIYDSALNGTQPADMCVKMNINALNTTHMNWTHDYVNTSMNRLESYNTIKTQVKIVDPVELEVDDGSPKIVNLGEWVDTQLLAANSSRYLVIADCEMRDYDKFGTVYYKLTEIAFLKRRGVELNQSEIDHVHQIVDRLFPRTETRKTEVDTSC